MPKYLVNSRPLQFRDSTISENSCSCYRPPKIGKTITNSPQHQGRFGIGLKRITFHSGWHRTSSTLKVTFPPITQLDLCHGDSSDSLVSWDMSPLCPQSMKNTEQSPLPPPQFVYARIISALSQYPYQHQWYQK
jgi:hypothetical protein